MVWPAIIAAAAPLVIEAGKALFKKKPDTTAPGDKMPQDGASGPKLPASWQPGASEGNVFGPKMPDLGVLSQTQQAIREAAYPAQEHSQRVARAEIERIKNTLSPELHTIKNELQTRATQIEATAEHRTIEANQRFQNTLLRNQSAIMRRLDRIERLTQKGRRY